MTAATFPRLRAAIFGPPQAIDPVAFQAIIEGEIGQRLASGNRIEGPAAKPAHALRLAEIAAAVDGQRVQASEGAVDYVLTDDGIAIVAVCGLLTRRFDWVAAMCGLTTYEGLSATLCAARDDGRVRGILLDVDSPGGEAAGMLDLADRIIGMRAAKPLWAVANAYAASAAYAIAGSAERLFVPRLGRVGSIGAVVVHMDQSKADQDRGLKFTAVYSGARKIDGFPYWPLSSPARASFQKGVDHCRQSFAALVERQGRMSQAEAMATEAEVYFDEAAVAAKLADEVGTFEEALAALSDHANGRERPKSKGTSAMSNTPTGPAAAAPTESLAAPAASAPAPPPAPAAAAPAEPIQAGGKPKEKAGGGTCAECGKRLADDEDGDEAKAQGYGLAAALETLELCAINKAPASTAYALVKAKTPVAQVRAALIKAAAEESAGEIDPTRTTVSADAGWGAVIEAANARMGVSRPSKPAGR